MSKQSIYGDRSQQVRDCFSRAGGAERVLVVPVDLAKEEHMAALCLGSGEYLCRPFPVRNTAGGLALLLGRIEGACARHGIGRRDVVVGGEDPCQHAFNFLHGLRLAGHPFVRVNAKEAAKLRNNHRATSDELALDGIAQALVQRRGWEAEEQDGLFSTLKQAGRSRRALVRQRTAFMSRIHRSVEVLFPGFLDESRSGICPFGRASMELMRKDFSCVRIARMRPATLVGRLRRWHTPHAEQAAAKLQALAAAALPPAPEAVPYEMRSLSAKVSMLETLRAMADAELEEMARCLACTPGFVLASIPGMGVALAAHIMAEFGDPERWGTADRMASYAGIVPRQRQTGGSGRAPVVGELPRDANRALKDYLLQAAHHVGTTGDHPLRAVHDRAVDRGGRERLATAKALVRTIRALVRAECVYLPPEARRVGTGCDTAAHLLRAADEMAPKWRGFDLSGIGPERNRLLQWRNTVDDIARYASQH
ncbi:MAG: transposase [Lentisphaeria bacterium]|jgi:transposase|nr:transposase [Lentisphaeria bacterium]